MMTYEQFAEQMERLEWLDWCAEMADSYMLTVQEQAQNEVRRRALVAQAGEGWLARWKEERKGK